MTDSSNSRASNPNSGKLKAGKPNAGKPNSGRLVILSGPSGVGKSTLVRKLLNRVGDKLQLSVSATTRQPRPGEENDQDYHFLTQSEFQSRREKGDFLECIEVFGRGHWYGTLLSEVKPSLEARIWVLLEIDVDGAERALKSYPRAVSLFVMPAEDPEEAQQVLKERLEVRGTEDAESIAIRLEVARREITRRDQYQHIIVNEGLDNAVDAIHMALKKEGFDG